MAKQGMARPERTHAQPRNDQAPVPQIQGKARHGKEKSEPHHRRNFRPSYEGLSL